MFSAVRARASWHKEEVVAGSLCMRAAAILVCAPQTAIIYPLIKIVVGERERSPFRS